MKTNLVVVVLLSALVSLSSASTLPSFAVYRRDDTPHTKAAASHPTSADSQQPHSVSTTPIAAPAVCGNGIIEKGEECDCGSPEECAKDPCCNAKTCKLTPGSQCSNKQECCSKCQFRPATFTCRAATSDCDATEMCTGTSGKCPANKKICSKPKHSNSTDASSSEAQMCGSVPCSDRDLQCQAQTTTAFSFTSSCAGAKETPTCQVSCIGVSLTQGSSGDTSGCYTLSAYYKDGTTCGQEGVCSNGVCTGDKSTVSFFKKNMTAFVIGGSCITAFIGLCFISICFLRRRKRIDSDKEKKEADSYQMSETMNQHERPKSNIRIGLDPYQNGLVEVLSKYDPNSGLGCRPADSKQQNISARAGYGKGAYPQDSLMTEQEMSEALESDTHKPLNPTLMTNWPMQPYTLPPISSPGKSPMLPEISSGHSSSLRKSPSSGNHILYIPPPLPPITLATSPTNPTSTVSPYADEAMIVFPPDSPPHGPISGSKGDSSQAKQASASRPPPGMPQKADNAYDSDDEPSFLQLDNSLTVDRYTKDNAKDRASVSSFFSTLALDPEPTPSLPPVPEVPPPKLLPSDEYIIPAPVARRVPRPASPMNGATRQQTPPVAAAGGGARRQRSGTNNIGVRPAPAAPSRVPVMSPDRRREESQVAACFAQDLGFEIVDPSPATSPRMGKKAVPTDSRVI